MKNKFKLLLAAIITWSQVTPSSGQSGIYLNKEDYKKSKLTNETDCSKGKQHIRLHDFIKDAPFVTVVSNGEKKRYKKDNLFGFRNCTGETYRFYKNAAYRIAEAGNIFIYSTQEHMSQSKGYKVLINYYFSKGADGAVLRLTKNNLKETYRNNDKFLDLIDEFFGNNDIAEYDNVRKMYKVNYVYSKSLN